MTDKLKTVLELLRANFDEKFNDPLLNEVYNLLDEPTREREEERSILAISKIACHPDLGGAISFEAQGNLTHSIADKWRIETILSSLLSFRTILINELTSDEDDRISFDDYKVVKNAATRLCWEIDRYQRAARVDPSGPRSLGTLGILQHQLEIESEFTDETSDLYRIETDYLATGGTSTTRHGSRN